MTTTGIIVMVSVFLVMDTIVVCAVFQLVKQTLRPLVQRFPPSQPMAEAVVKHRQSFKIGMLNMGGCFTVAADAAALHLRPNRLGRLVGGPAMSVPWEAIEHRGPARGLRLVFGSVARVRVGMTDIVGPAWCLDLAKITEK